MKATAISDIFLFWLDLDSDYNWPLVLLYFHVLLIWPKEILIVLPVGFLQCDQGLGKDGAGIVEPVQAQAMDVRAGLGSQQRKPVDPSLEVQAGDSYRTLIQKKALARFREMS